MASKNRELWIGLAHVEQNCRGGLLGDADRAYVNVIGSATGLNSFRRQIKKDLASVGMVLLRLKDPEPLEMRLSKQSIHKDLLRLAKQVQKTGELRFDVFATYDLGT